MYYKSSRILTAILSVVGFIFFIIAVKFTSAILFLLGTILLISGLAVHWKYGICPECKKHIPPTLGHNHCPHCGERLI